MKTGDTVRFNAEWCRNTGNFFGPIPFLKGTILSLGEPMRPNGPCIVVVAWNDGTIGKTLSSNLESTGRMV